MQRFLNMSLCSLCLSGKYNQKPQRRRGTESFFQYTSLRLRGSFGNIQFIKKFALKDDGFYKIKSRTEYLVCWSYPDGYEIRYSVKGRTLHVTHDNPNKIWLDVYPGVFHGRLLESYEVLIRDNKVEAYRRDYPDAQTGLTVLRYRSTS